MTEIRKLESYKQALMLVRSSLVAHDELIGMLGNAAVYAYSTGSTRTAIVRPAGPYADGVVFRNRTFSTAPVLIDEPERPVHIPSVERRIRQRTKRSKNG